MGHGTICPRIFKFNNLDSEIQRHTFIDDKSTLEAISRVVYAREGGGCVTSNCRQVYCVSEKVRIRQGGSRIIPPPRNQPNGDSTIAKNQAITQLQLQYVYLTDTLQGA